jgi:hypothetical protein
MKNGRSIRFAVAVIAISAFCFKSVEAQDRRVDQPLPDDLYKLFEEKREVIGNAIAKSKNEWAGTYLAGDHHPTVFMWTPEAGFLVSSSHHTFAPSWINYGKVEIVGEILTIRPELLKDNSSAHLMPTEFRLVRWGRHHFLIPPSDLKSFAYAAHSGAESEIVQYFARGEDRDHARRGLPNLPAEYLELIKMPPIIARVTFVGPEDYSQEVTLAAGRRHRVVEGMIFYYRAGNGAQFSVRINEVGERSSKGEVWSIVTISEVEKVRIRPGLILSSKTPKGFIEPG